MEAFARTYCRRQTQIAQMPRESQRPRYPHLAPELQRLTGDALRIWGSATVRQDAFERIVAALEEGGNGFERVVGPLDAAVCAGLAALGLPRGGGVSFAAGDPGMRGTARLGLDRVFRLNPLSMRHVLHDLRQPGDLFRTWVHESLHGRLEDMIVSETEQRELQGYEEGMAEGLAQIVTHDRAGMEIRESSYHYFVVAYRALAAAMELDVERLWRRVWRLPRGRLRAGFVGALAELCRDTAGTTLTPAQRGRLQAQADRQFATQNATRQPNESVIAAQWRMAFR